MALRVRAAETKTRDCSRDGPSAERGLALPAPRVHLCRMLHPSSVFRGSSCSRPRQILHILTLPAQDQPGRSGGWLLKIKRRLRGSALGHRHGLGFLGRRAIQACARHTRHPWERRHPRRGIRALQQASRRLARRFSAWSAQGVRDTAREALLRGYGLPHEALNIGLQLAVESEQQLLVATVAAQGV